MPYENGTWIYIARGPEVPDGRCLADDQGLELGGLPNATARRSAETHSAQRSQLMKSRQIACIVEHCCSCWPAAVRRAEQIATMTAAAWTPTPLPTPTPTPIPYASDRARRG